MFGKKTPALTERDVLEALKGVKDPDLNRDLVDLGMIKDVRITDGGVALTVNLTTPACPLKAKIEADVRAALASRLGPDLHVQVSMTADVRGKGVAEKGDIPGVKNVIAVGSGKGGVGKSTMAAAIAYGLKSYGATVGVMDADVYGPSIPHLVGATGRPMAKGDRIQPIEANGLKLMSMGFLLEPERAVIMRGPMLHGIMQQFLHQVDWGQLDYLVIDLPPGTGDVPLTLAQALPLTGAVVVCTPQEVALLGRRAGGDDVPPAQGADPGDGREHELLRREGLPAGPRQRGGRPARRRPGLLRRAGRRARVSLRPRRRPPQGRGARRAIPGRGPARISASARSATRAGSTAPTPTTRRAAPISWPSSSSSPPRSASRTSRRRRCRSWRSSTSEIDPAPADLPSLRRTRTAERPGLPSPRDPRSHGDTTPLPVNATGQSF